MTKTFEFSNGFIIDLTAVWSVSPTYAHNNRYVIAFTSGKQESVLDDEILETSEYAYPRTKFVEMWKQALG